MVLTEQWDSLNTEEFCILLLLEDNLYYVIVTTVSTSSRTIKFIAIVSCLYHLSLKLTFAGIEPVKNLFSHFAICSSLCAVIVGPILFPQAAATELKALEAPWMCPGVLCFCPLFLCHSVLEMPVIQGFVSFGSFSGEKSLWKLSWSWP